MSMSLTASSLTASPSRAASALGRHQLHVALGLLPARRGSWRTTTVNKPRVREPSAVPWLPWDCALGRTGTPATPRNKTVPKQVKGVAVDIIGVIIAGIIIGLLGKFFAPGNRDNIPLWLTIVCGIGGVLIGYYLAAALGVEATRGIDWTRWIISIVVAAVLVTIAASVTRDAAERSNQLPTTPLRPIRQCGGDATTH